MTTALALHALLTSRDGHCSATAYAESRSYRPGAPITVAVRLKSDPGWHTYWANPGDSGSATTVDWRLPEGWRAGPLQFAVPERIRVGEYLVCYGYFGETVLLQTLTPPPGPLPRGSTVMPLSVSWVVCKEECVAGNADLNLRLTSGDGAPDPAVASVFKAARAQLAMVLQDYRARAVKSGERYRLEVTAPQPWTSDAAQAMFYPLDREALEHADPQSATVSGRLLTLILKPSGFQTVALRRLRGLLVAPNSSVFLKKTRAQVIDVPIEAS